MPSLQKIKAKRTKSYGRGASAKYLWRKQFKLDGNEVTLRLGLMSEKAAIETSGHIDHLIESWRYKTGVHEATQSWLKTADSKIVNRLVAIGLCVASQNPTVAECVTTYIKRKTVDWADNTVSNFGQVRTLLIEHFPAKRVQDVSVADAKEFWSWMRKDRKLGENTCRKHFQRSRQVFDDMVEQGVLVRNPFRVNEIKVAVGVADKTYVADSTIETVIEHLPADKTEWKLLFAFARYVGCRMPSEIRELKLDHIDWNENTILIHAPKTKSRRLVPIFPEISKLLLKQAESVPTGTEYLFPNLRTHSNLGTTAKKHVARAGFDPWTEFWNSLRASRETDLMDSHGLRRACAWIGNSPTTAMKHYALLKKSDFLDVGNSISKSAEKSAESLARIVANGGEQTFANPINPGLVGVSVPPGGIEPPAKL